MCLHYIVSAGLQVTQQGLMGSVKVKAEQSHSLNTKKLRVPCASLSLAILFTTQLRSQIPAAQGRNNLSGKISSLLELLFL